MGLSISRTIVEDHGGQIWATPNEDAGATFLFTLATDPGAGPPTVAQESDNPQMHRLS
jgi:signal transduction histidine kinase